MRMRLLTSALSVAVVAAACGTSERPPTSSTVTTTPTGPVTTVEIVEPEEPVDGWTVAFEAGTPWGPDGHGAGGYWETRLLVGENGMLVAAMGEGDEHAAIDLYRSTNGLDWEQLDPVFGSSGIEYFDLALATDAGYVIGGLIFEEEGDQVGSWMLESSDGVEWSDADTGKGLAAITASFIRTEPDPGMYGSVDTVVRFGDGFVAGGSADEAAVVWLSDDATEWEQITVASGSGVGISGLVVIGDRIYAVGNAPGMTVWESTDGRSWAEVAGREAFGLQPTPVSDDADGEPFHGHDAWFAGLAPYADGMAALIQVSRRSGEEWCFVDAERCNLSALELVYSTDGRSWQALPLPDDASLMWDGSIARSRDGLVLVEANDGQLQIWTAGNLGSGTPIQAAQVPELGFDVVQWDATIEEGVTYGYAYWTHCGIDRLGEFNGQVWELIEDRTSDLPQEEWNNQYEMLYGTMVLVAPDRIEYSMADTVIAVYAPAEDPEEMLCA